MGPGIPGIYVPAKPQSGWAYELSSKSWISRPPDGPATLGAAAADVRCRGLEIKLGYEFLMRPVHAAEIDWRRLALGRSVERIWTWLVGGLGSVTPRARCWKRPCAIVVVSMRCRG